MTNKLPHMISLIRSTNELETRTENYHGDLFGAGSQRMANSSEIFESFAIHPAALTRLVELLAGRQELFPLVFSSVPVGWLEILSELLEAAGEQHDAAIKTGWRLRMIHYGAKFGGLTMRYEFMRIAAVGPGRALQAAASYSGQPEPHTAEEHEDDVTHRAHRSAMDARIERARHKSLDTCALCGAAKRHSDGFSPSLCGHHTVGELIRVQSLVDDQILSGVAALRAQRVAPLPRS